MIDALDDECDYAEVLHVEISKRAYVIALDKAVRMASAIEVEREGMRKRKMIEAYEKVDKELETWKRLAFQQ